MLKWIIKQLSKEKNVTPDKINKIKRRAAFLFKKNIPLTSAILEEYHRLVKKNKIKKSQKLEELLRIRKIRTLSGVAVVTVLTKPYKCPGRCLFCPTEKDMPKSYLKNEPAAARAYALGFNPYRQVQTRLRALQATGHKTDKIELIVLGGTWSAYTKKYKYWFIRECFKAANEFPVRSQISNFKFQANSKSPIPKSQKDLRNQLKKEQKRNESAKNRIVGLTLETRPDYVTKEEILEMRDLGCTRLEIGVQSVDDKILKLNKRELTASQTILATKLLKNAGLKINYHMMVNLPGSNPQKDFLQFKNLFENPNFRPDLLKIYPCSILKTAPLYRVYKQGKYRPYSEKQLKNLLIKIKQIIPPYVRIQRVIRDIPKESIMAGSEVSNLRQLIHQEMAEKKLVCRCIRCREIKNAIHKKLILVRREYSASGGQEIFLSFEDAKKQNLYALLRLRLTDSPLLPVLQNSALIREVHTYGQLAPINKKGFVQHKGLGKKLMAEAENIVRKETKYKKIAVISGVGVRQYYRQLGYRLQNEYMVKKF